LFRKLYNVWGMAQKRLRAAQNASVDDSVAGNATGTKKPALAG
jgi:hypothetical protein